MQVKRFVAKDMRRALEMVRQALGEEAIIHSSRRVKDGVELLTSVAGSTFTEPKPTPEVESAPSSAPPSESPAPVQTGRDIAAQIELASQRLAARELAEASADEYLRKDQVVNAGIRVRSAVAQTPTSLPTAAPEADRPRTAQTAAERYGLAEPLAQSKSSDDIELLHEEIAQMRLILEEQLGRLGAAARGPGSKQTSAIGQRLERMGFSAKVADATLRRPLNNRMLAKAWPEAMARLAHAIPVMDEDITANGGVFAFVGPTGAGKTTTVAKLAARYVMEHGADKVALVTNDTQRLGGQDQLRSIARILQVPLRVVDENNSLSAVLRSLRNCELVLIDTAGLRAGDPALKTGMQELANIRSVQSLLVLPANSQAQVLKAALHSYQTAALTACIITKLDEAASLGEAVDCAMQARLPIAYTCDGQEVPYDIEQARGHKLISKAAQLIQQSSSRQAVNG
ncbi:flagellar biosynthesis protein FlhF [Gilvimarinus sp. DA14]|uniref:flagellar biosynthesis protein FlhF n=1 Tax=Gilvimarinus sp. DA14 TaxID=2956798 RepID=UPI0020B7DF40|nr:flagellar biosynthesis protein FlhF [Gilvimarinus sp. DA14]UTF60779.1 flagellar biosynthesis protein FlhF [Gilvimarinus sp. DA14]